jgi:hypothetical protein
MLLLPLQVRAQNFLGASAASAIFLLRADADAAPKLLVLPMSKTVFTPAEDVEIKGVSVRRSSAHAAAGHRRRWLRSAPASLFRGAPRRCNARRLCTPIMHV